MLFDQFSHQGFRIQWFDPIFKRIFFTMRVLFWNCGKNGKDPNEEEGLQILKVIDDEINSKIK